MNFDDAVTALVWSDGTNPDWRNRPFVHTRHVTPTYPNGINAAVAENLNSYDDIVARTAMIDDPNQGVRDDVLKWADVLVWWGHARHADVLTDTVDRIQSHVEERGMGFVCLHSAHASKPFKRLCGTSGDIGDVRIIEGDSEHLTVVDPTHPLADGVEDFSIPSVEAFDEPFDVPEPDDVVLESTYDEGGTFRSGVTFTFGAGRGVYLRPGHEEFRIYHHPPIERLVYNAVRWAGRAV